MNKKNILYIMVFMLCVLCGCGREKKPENNSSVYDKESEADMNVSLYDKGLEIVQEMYMLAGDDAYIQLASGGSVDDMVKSISELDYGKPENVYRVTNPESSFNMMMAFASGQEEELSEAAKEHIYNTIGSGVANNLNARLGGTMNLAAAGVLNCYKCFVCEPLENVEMYIYAYEDAYPVLITFIPGEDGAVSASGYFIIAESLIGTDKEQFEEIISISGYHMSLEEITQ